MEKQSMPAVGISLEQDTERTPDTTQFHLFQNETLLASFDTRHEGEQAYREALAASGYQRPVAVPSEDGVSLAEREHQGRQGRRGRR